MLGWVSNIVVEGGSCTIGAVLLSGGSSAEMARGSKPVLREEAFIEVDNES